MRCININILVGFVKHPINRYNKTMNHVVYIITSLHSSSVLAQYNIISAKCIVLVGNSVKKKKKSSRL